MSKLKNKDGVPIRVGQVWTTTDEMVEWEIVALHNTIVVAWEIGFGDSYHGFTPAQFIRLKSDPQWGDMSEWRIVTEEEKRERGIAIGMEYWDEGIWKPITNANATIPLRQNTPVRVPRDFRWPTEKKPVKLEEHRIDLIKPLYNTTTQMSTNNQCMAYYEKINKIIEVVNTLIKRG